MGKEKNNIKQIIIAIVMIAIILAIIIAVIVTKNNQKNNKTNLNNINNIIIEDFIEGPVNDIPTNEAVNITNDKQT